MCDVNIQAFPIQASESDGNIATFATSSVWLTSTTSNRAPFLLAVTMGNHILKYLPARMGNRIWSSSNENDSIMNTDLAIYTCAESSIKSGKEPFFR